MSGSDRPSEQTSDALRELAQRWVAAFDAHDLDAAVDCFDPAYVDEAPARPGESVHGSEEVRANFGRLLENLPDLRVELLGTAVRGDEVWIEWRMQGTRADGSRMAFVGVNIFLVRDGRFADGRIYTELVRDAGDVEAQIQRMTEGDGPGPDEDADD